jgi:2-oxo-4-hydroxy-4-carboxy--5-ureidoimidazoline (OHCU) decarboxylase
MQPSQLDKIEFMALFGSVFEHSPWIAMAVWDAGLTGRHDTAAGLHQPFREVIRRSGREEKLALLRAHPELAKGIASASLHGKGHPTCKRSLGAESRASALPQQDEQLTDSSQREQRGAGLDHCSPEEFSEFENLNDSYRDKFGFPFIMAVKGCNRHDILESFRARLKNTRDMEFQTAVEQVIRIGRFRIDSIFAEKG